MDFEQWQERHGPNGCAYDIEMQRAGWDGRKQQVDDLASLVRRLAHSLDTPRGNTLLARKAVAILSTEGLGPNATAVERDPHQGGDNYEASMLRNLLARIHRDGGHYVKKHGLDKALEDADAQVVRWLALKC